MIQILHLLLAGISSPELLRGLSDSAATSLVAAIWQGTLLAAAAAASLRLLPKMPAAARFAIWFGVFLLVIGLPLIALLHHPAPASVSAGHAAWLTLNSRWSEAILACWAAASLARATTLCLAVFRVRSLWHSATPLPGAPSTTPALGRTVQVCTSDQVDRPSVIGFFSPKILIPTWLADKLSPEEMNHVILHEAGHLRRADDWLNLLQKLALVIFPLNPSLVWIERRLCFERELACDDRVLRATGSPKAYASCLASLAEHRMTRRGVALVMSALGRESDLGQRVLRILTRGDRMRPLQTRLAMGAAALALIGAASAFERTPQLVGFAPAISTQQASIIGSEVAPSQPPNAIAYQPVVFRPQALPSALAKKMAEQGSATTGHGQSPKPSARKRQAASSTNGFQPQSDGSGWLLMTSTTTWSDSGSRVVLTSIRTTTQVAPNAATEVRSDYASPAVTATAPPGARSQQVYPYAAAVPVRGGWLIIQL